MPVAVLASIALIPIGVALVLMVGLRWPATKAMPLAWLAAAVSGALVWKMPLGFILAATLAGFGGAINILIIVFGAIVILYTLRDSGAMETINHGFHGISTDRRVQAIIIGFMFGAFLEGAAGFGTPAAIAAPLLLSLGFPPLAAAIVCLVYNSVPVSFGAAGTPIRFGLALLQPQIDAALQMSSALGFADVAGFYQVIARWASVLHALPGFVLPLFVVCFMTRYFGQNRSWSEGLGVWKFSLFASVSFFVPYIATAFLIGEEFPSLIGGLIGLAIIVSGAKRGWFMPEQPWDFGPQSAWDKEWTGQIATEETRDFKPTMSLIRAWTPYVLIGLILVATRVSFLPFRAWLSSVTVSWSQILGYETVNIAIQPLFLPGVVPFMLVALLTIGIHGMKAEKVKAAWGDSSSPDEESDDRPVLRRGPGGDLPTIGQQHPGLPLNAPDHGGDNRRVGRPIMAVLCLLCWSARRLHYRQQHGFRLALLRVSIRHRVGTQHLPSDRCVTPGGGRGHGQHGLYPQHRRRLRDGRTGRHGRCHHSAQRGSDAPVRTDCGNSRNDLHLRAVSRDFLISRARGHTGKVRGAPDSSAIDAYALNPFGFACCQRQASIIISSSPRVARQPSALAATAESA